jgi:hypothetical protein
MSVDAMQSIAITAVALAVIVLEIGFAIHMFWHPHR